MIYYVYSLRTVRYSFREIMVHNGFIAMLEIVNTFSIEY